MTVQTPISVSGPYNGNGAQVAFAFGFKIFAEGDIEVIETSAAGLETVKQLTTHYTVNAGPWPTGGTVTMLVAPASGTTLTIRRNLSSAQNADYITGGKFPAEAHEAALDRAVMLLQQMQADLDRAMLVQKSEGIDPADLELPFDRALTYLAFDAQKKPIAAVQPVGGTPVTPFAATVLDDPNAPTAKQTLEVRDDHVAVFTASGDFTVPKNVTALFVLAIGSGAGGGSGAARASAEFAGGGAGGEAGQTKVQKLTVVPDAVLTVTIGAKGTGGASVSGNVNGNPGTDGGDTIFDSITALGGKAGTAATQAAFPESAIGGVSASRTGAQGGAASGASAVAGGSTTRGGGGNGGGGSSSGNQCGGGGGGGNSSAGPGGNGGAGNNAGSATAGSAPAATSLGAGGGGGGGSVTGNSGAGADGQNGAVVIWW